MRKLDRKTLENIFANAPEATVLHDLAGNLIQTNRAFDSLVGCSAAELEGANLQSLLSEESFLVLTAALENLIQSENAQESLEATLTRRDGGRATYNLRSLIAERRAGAIIFQTSLSDVSRQKALEDSLHLYVQQATRAQEEERKRLAMELHDQTIQDLVVLSRHLDLLEGKGPTVDEDYLEELRKIKRQLSDIIQSLRNLSQNLRPATLDRLGLLAALGHLANELKRSSGIEVVIRARGRQVRLSEEVELMLFRIAQEALNNVWRHSQASRVDIAVQYDKAKVKVLIKDNGQGFDSQDNWLNITQNGKLGVVGMRERARLINGTFSIQSEPGKGTRIAVEAPLNG